MKIKIARIAILLVLSTVIWFGCSDNTIVPEDPNTSTTTTTSGVTTNHSSTTGSSTTGVTTTGGSTTSGTTTGVTYNPFFQFELEDTTVKAASFLADYGEKIYVTGLDEHSNLAVDFSFPAKKGQLMLDKPFAYDDLQGHAKGIFYIGSNQWVIQGGTVNITKHSENRISGDFSGPAYLFDYASGKPVAIDSGSVRNGVFRDIFVKE